MEKTFSNLLAEVIKAYGEKKVLNIAVDRSVGYRKNDNYDTIKVTIINDDEFAVTNHEVSCTFNTDTYEHWELRCKPRSYYDEEEYDYILELIQKARTVNEMLGL